MDLPVFEPMPMPVCGTRSKRIIQEDKEKFLIDNFNSMNNKGLAKRLGCSVDTICVNMRRLKLKRKRFFKGISAHDLGLMLEEYFCTDCTVVYLAAKYGVTVYLASRYISYMIPLKLNEDRVVVVKESKV